MRNDKESLSKATWQGMVGLCLLGAVYAASILWAYVINREPQEGGTTGVKIIRMAHKVTERSVQLAFEQLVHDYEKIHPDVKVIVESIPEAAYKQWATTQCLGGTAPDLLQAEGIFDPGWAMMAVRHMVPLTPYVNKPNEYNRNTPLEGLNWRDTYIDGMKSGYWYHLTEFYSVPITVETTRVFYNKDIFQAATGSDERPEDFRDWLRICERIRAYARSEGRTLFPISSSRESFVPQAGTQLLDYYYVAMTDGMADELDVNYWGGWITPLYALYQGVFTFNQSRIEAPFQMTRQIGQYCQPGYVSTEQDQARFLFIQGKAAMVVGNVKDAKIFRDAARFRLGVFDCPLPAKDDPDYGQYVVGRPSESELSVAMHFCLSQTSRNPEIAVDFLKFCTSVEKNEQFNAAVHWYPIIRTAKPRDYLRVFEPQIQGPAYQCVELTLGETRDVGLWFQQQFPLYLDGRISFEALVEGLEEVWLTKGARDYVDMDRHFKKSLIPGERNIAMAQAQMLFQEAGELKAGQTFSQRTNYQHALEVIQLLEHGISARTYTWHHLQKGDYQYP